MMKRFAIGSLVGAIVGLILVSFSITFTVLFSFIWSIPSFTLLIVIIVVSALFGGMINTAEPNDDEGPAA